jgi:hypothetical protein
MVVEDYLDVTLFLPRARAVDVPSQQTQHGTLVEKLSCRYVDNIQNINSVLTNDHTANTHSILLVSYLYTVRTTTINPE